MWVLRLDSANSFSTQFVERCDPVYVYHYSEDERYIISCPNRLNYWRAKTLFTKEPDMINWINLIPNDSVVLDVGANIGLYSIYAAKKSNIKKVVAIEPESQNYALLNKNIFLNQVSDKVVALNIGFGQKTGLDTLFLSNFEPGAALHQMGEILDWKKEKFIPAHKQSVLSFTIDDFLQENPDLFPTHIKIDVDGIEQKVIEGAMKTLRDPGLKEVMIELNSNLLEDKWVIEQFADCGFSLIRNEHSPLLKSEMWDGVDNYLFSRQ